MFISICMKPRKCMVRAFSCGEIHIKFKTFPVLRAQFIDINYIHIIVQPSPSVRVGKSYSFLPFLHLLQERVAFRGKTE